VIPMMMAIPRHLLILVVATTASLSPPPAKPNCQTAVLMPTASPS
jgi:hypothetical protein